MKSVWLWVAFLVLYGVFSLKTHAVDLAVAGQGEIAGSGSPVGSLRWSA